MPASQLRADAHSLTIDQGSSDVVTDGQHNSARSSENHRQERSLGGIQVEASDEQTQCEEAYRAYLRDEVPRSQDLLPRATDHRQVVYQASDCREHRDGQPQEEVVESGSRERKVGIEPRSDIEDKRYGKQGRGKMYERRMARVAERLPLHDILQRPAPRHHRPLAPNASRRHS